MNVGTKIQVFGGIHEGFYYIQIRVGSEKVMQSVIVDTGSSQLIIPTRNCKQCGKHDFDLFDPSRSKSFT